MKLIKSILVEVVLGSGSEHKFPDETFLKGKKIIAIEGYTSTQVGKTPTGLTVPSADICHQGFVNLVNGNENRHMRMPISSLVTSENNGVVKEFEPFELSVSKSSLWFPDSSVLTAGTAVPFLIHYSD